MAKLERRLGINEVAESIRPFFSSENMEDVHSSNVLGKIREFLRDRGIVDVEAFEVTIALNMFYQRGEIIPANFVNVISGGEGDGEVVLTWKFKPKPE